MATRSDVVGEQLDELAQDLRDLWHALTADPKKQARKERAWTILAGAVGVLGTMVARQAAAKVWRMLTGEQPPVGRPAPAPDAGRQPPPATPAVREEAVPAGSAAASP